MPEHILQMGYYPDRFATHDVPPDVFFIHLVGDVDWITAAQALESACCEKYHLTDERHGYEGFLPFVRQDCFWSVAPRPQD